MVSHWKRVVNKVSSSIIPRQAVLPHYYPQQPSCQIPNAWWLFSMFLGERRNGYFVEVGAYDGVFVSNTWGLAVREWEGLMLEPVPHLARLCRDNHSNHPWVRVIESAAGPVDSSQLTLHLAGTLTTANSEAFEEYADVDWAKSALTSKTIAVPSQTFEPPWVCWRFHTLERRMESWTNTRSVADGIRRRKKPQQFRW